MAVRTLSTSRVVTALVRSSERAGFAGGAGAASPPPFPTGFTGSTRARVTRLARPRPAWASSSTNFP
jgi:hypothetical protein